MNTPDVTIVVCTYNRATHLANALESLGALELGPHSACILVVDNNSTDDTAAVVERIAAGSSIPVRRVVETAQGIVPARNRGIAEARGEWIAFFDDDQLADPNWIAELLALAARRDVRFVGGAVDLKLPEGTGPVESLSPVVRMLLGETVRMNSERPYSQRVTPGCGNMLVHRSVFDEIGTFDAAYADRGEDTDLWMRMLAVGIRGWYTPRAVVHHVIPAERLEPAFLMRLARTMAKGMAADELETWGRRYPLIWLARLGQLVGVLGPRWTWATLTHNHASVLGTRCRLVIARHVLADGLGLMFRSRPVRTPRRTTPDVLVSPNTKPMHS